MFREPIEVLIMERDRLVVLDLHWKWAHQFFDDPVDLELVDSR
jgi:hypothetical protein